MKKNVKMDQSIKPQQKSKITTIWWCIHNDV